MSTYEPPPPPDANEPPAGGGYGAPPPPPPGGYGTGGYGTPAPKKWDLGAALSYGWAKFQENVGQIILAAVVLVVGIGLVSVVGFLIIGAITSTDCGYRGDGTYTCEGGIGFIGGLVLNALFAAVVLVIAQVIGAGVVRGGLAITEGRRFQTSELFRTDKLGSVLVAALIIAAATFVGTLLCYVPGLVVGFVTSYTLFFILDQDLAPVDAIKASFELVRNNLGDTIIWYLVGGLIAGVGFAVCLVGAVVSVPVVLIGSAYTYKKLTDQPVAA